MTDAVAENPDFAASGSDRPKAVVDATGRPPCCPRCGYDQTGLLQTYRDAWPLLARCTECGLDFDWRDILDSRIGSLEWFESSPTVRFPLLLRTIAGSFAPWRLWKRLRLEYEFDFGRVILVAIGSVVVVYLLGVILGLGARLPTGVFWEIPEILMLAPSPNARSMRGAFMSIVTIAGALAANGATALSFLILSESLARFKIRKLHLWRGVLYSCGPMVASAAIPVLMTAVVSHRSFAWAFDDRFSLVYWMIPIAVLSICWWQFCRHYLRLPRAAFIAAMLCAIGSLAGALLVLACSIGYFRIVTIEY